MLTFKKLKAEYNRTVFCLYLYLGGKYENKQLHNGRRDDILRRCTKDF